MQYRLGVDLGGTKIEIVALNQQGDKVFSKRLDTPNGCYLSTLKAIVKLVNDAENFLETELDADLTLPVALGIGIPGSISPRTGLVRNANSTWLIDQDLKGDLQKQLNRNIAVENDANCFALSEAVDGAGRHAKTVFGVIIGTGCGGALIIDKKVLTGANAIAGEWGHNPLPWIASETDHLHARAAFLDCYCGLKGCNETFLSGSAIESHFVYRGGERLTAKKIVALSEQGDVRAKELMDDYIVWLAKGLASVINLFDPDVIVLGGGLSNVQRIYHDVPAIWDQWIFCNEPAVTQLLPPEFGDSSGVRGAAWLS